MQRTLDTPYIVTDPRICHGKITFRGTRVFVADILNDIARDQDRQFISKNWHGLALEAIAEAVRLANQTFSEYADEYIVEYVIEDVPV